MHDLRRTLTFLNADYFSVLKSNHPVDYHSDYGHKSRSSTSHDASEDIATPSDMHWCPVNLDSLSRMNPKMLRAFIWKTSNRDSLNFRCKVGHCDFYCFPIDMYVCYRQLPSYVCMWTSKTGDSLYQTFRLNRLNDILKCLHRSALNLHVCWMEATVEWLVLHEQCKIRKQRSLLYPRNMWLIALFLWLPTFANVEQIICCVLHLIRNAQPLFNGRANCPRAVYSHMCIFNCWTYPFYAMQTNYGLSEWALASYICSTAGPSRLRKCIWAFSGCGGNIHHIIFHLLCAIIVGVN